MFVNNVITFSKCLIFCESLGATTKNDKTCFLTLYNLDLIDDTMTLAHKEMVIYFRKTC